jgi:hypothetical protein
MQSSRQIVSALLAVDRKKGSEEEGRIRAFPVIIALLNLLFCGYMDHFLRQDVDGHYLATLFFIECAMMVLIAIGTFGMSSAEILAKSSIFPTTQLSRLAFVLISFLRKPAIAALWLTTSIFMIVFFYRSPVVASFALALFIILAMDVLLLTATVGIKLTGSSHPIAGFAIFSVFIIVTVLVSAIVFRFTFLVDSFPVLSWAVRGIRAANRSATGIALLNGGYMAMTFVALLFIGRRVA